MEGYSLAGKRVWVAGHHGLAGSALVRQPRKAPIGELLTVPRERLDLREKALVEDWISQTRPQAIFLAAAKVGDIHANDIRPVDFICDNLLIQTNIIKTAHDVGVEKLLFLGSSCIYPRMAPQPIEKALLAGLLELTTERYAVAKIAGIKLCQAFRKQYGDNFITAMPCNLYGPNDNFDLDSGHVVPSLLRRFHEATAGMADAVAL
jgi:GDP-L-fucose synthase